MILRLCRDCGVLLSEDNMYLADFAKGNNICRRCEIKHFRAYNAMRKMLAGGRIVDGKMLLNKQIVKNVEVIEKCGGMVKVRYDIVKGGGRWGAKTYRVLTWLDSKILENKLGVDDIEQLS